MSAEVRALIERFDHLRNSGVCSPTTRDLLDDAQSLLLDLSTPPADDVREALIEAVRTHALTVHILADVDPSEFADAILAVFEVRPRGTVTDATRVSVDQRDAVVDHVWDQMVGVAKSAVREVMADAFASAGIGVADEEVPGFEGTRDALDSLSIRGGESS